ncbi:MAG TPA: amphi-Trp domain-containing protein [Sedimenticola sp.]|nr:amphi-Trp domain-containing protein [Sedimenticola sp.]
MNQDKKVFRHESLQDARSIRGVLKALLKGLEKGKVSFRDEDGEILMEPRGLLRRRLKASQDENRQSINLRVSWQVEDEVVKKKGSLKVSSD